MKKAILNLEPLACPTCMQKIEGALLSVKGVDQKSIKVMFNSSKAKLLFNQNETSLQVIQEAVENVGYKVLKAVERV